MKIGILSLTMERNYGGILQQYALSTYLKSLGYEVVTINRQPNDGGFVMRLFRKILRMLGVRRYRREPKDKTKIKQFIDNRFIVTNPIYSSSGFKRLLKKEGIDAIVYGSDQIWRREYELKCGLDFFGVSTPINVKQIAYAPSFGLDKWEYSIYETNLIKKSLKHFSAISSREESGVKLIEDNLQLKASLVCDPTMLIDRDYYCKLASINVHKKPYCFVYWLGDQESMNKVIEEYQSKSELEVVVVNLRDTFRLPSIEEWLSLVKNALYIITDSYHGMVFSLLFERQFEVHCNKSGGYDRIQTLMFKLNLEEKLSDIGLSVDYKIIKKTLTNFREESRIYLNNALTI